MHSKLGYHMIDMLLISFSYMFSAALTNFSCIIALLLWRPHPDQLPVFFVFPALWGMADAIWQTQTNGKKIPSVHEADTWRIFDLQQKQMLRRLRLNMSDS